MVVDIGAISNQHSWKSLGVFDDCHIRVRSIGILGALLLALAPAFGWVVLGRFIGIAVSGIADASYSHKIAFVSVNKACLSLGFLMAFCIGVILVEENTSPFVNWLSSRMAPVPCWLVCCSIAADIDVYSVPDVDSFEV